MFDHFQNLSFVAGTDPTTGQKLAETLDKQREAVTAGGSQPAQADDQSDA